MTSSSNLGSTSIILQFDLSRDIDAAARDVQAAINAARSYLPAGLPNNPTYRKVNPADAPIMILALTSDTYDRGRMYDVGFVDSPAETFPGGGRRTGQVGGGALPAVRVDVNPRRPESILALGLEDVRTVLAAARTRTGRRAIVERPIARLGDRNNRSAAKGRRIRAADRRLSERRRPVRLRMSPTVTDSVEDIRDTRSGQWQARDSRSFFFGSRAQTSSTTVDRVRALLPHLRVFDLAGDRSCRLCSIARPRSALRVQDVEITLVFSIVLVILVVFVFLQRPSHDAHSKRRRSRFAHRHVRRDVSCRLQPGQPVSDGSDDRDGLRRRRCHRRDRKHHAISGTEACSRIQAAVRGAQEIGFTVFSISLSLVAVFIPILLMGGIVGRLLREFAVTLSVAIGVSLLVSLTTTPMMCAQAAPPGG